MVGVRALCAAGADPAQAGGRDGRSAVGEAARTGNLPALRHLLRVAPAVSPPACPTSDETRRQAWYRALDGALHVSRNVLVLSAVAVANAPTADS